MREDLPEGWTAATLGQVVSRPRAKAAPSQHPDLPFVGMDSIAPGGMSLRGTGRFGDMKSAGGIFEAGDVLYGRMRPYLNKVHRARHQGACSAEFIVMPPDGSIDGDFLAYLVHQRSFVNYASDHCSGDRPRVDFESIASYQFGLPPKAEQQRIVSRIEELFSEIDAGERALERVRNLVERYRRSLLKDAVIGGSTIAWREKLSCFGDSGTAMLDEMAASAKGLRANRQIQSRPRDVINLLSLPKGWSWARAEAVCHLITKGTTPAPSAMHSAPGDVPFIKVYNLTFNGSLDFSIDPTFIDEATHIGALARSRVHPGDVLMNIVGPPLGKVSIVPATHCEWNMNQAVCVFRPLLGLDPDFLAYYLLSRTAQDWLASRSKATVGQMNLTLEICRDLPIPIPPHSEQQEIVQLAKTKLARLDNLSGSLVIEAARSKALRQSVLKAAFAGQLVPQDPTDEPASTLLARLAAESSDTPTAARRSGRPPAAKRP